MSIANILPLITQFSGSSLGVAVIGLVVAWLGGKGVTALLRAPFSRRLLGLGLKSAGAPAVILGKWLQVGPLHILSGPIVCLLVFIGFWFFTFMDRLLTYLRPETCAMVEDLEKMLSEMGSTDRKLYIQSKTMTAPQVTAVSQIAAAVAAGPANLDSQQQDILLKARAIGADLQQGRLEQN